MHSKDGVGPDTKPGLVPRAVGITKLWLLISKKPNKTDCKNCCKEREIMGIKGMNEGKIAKTNALRKLLLREKKRNGLSAEADLKGQHKEKSDSRETK